MNKNLLGYLIIISSLASHVSAQVSDIDADSVPDSTDNCISIANTDQTNSDGDRYGDACDIDDDNDGLIDHFDTAPLDATSPTNATERLVITKRRIIGFGQVEDMALGTSLDIASGTLVIGAPFSTSHGEINIFEQAESGDYQIREKLTGDNESRILGSDVDVTAAGDFLLAADPNGSEGGTQSGRLLTYQNLASKWAAYGGAVFGESSFAFMQRVRGSANGMRMVGGSPRHLEKIIGLPDSAGYLRTFDLVDNTWTESAARLQGSARIDQFGHTLDLSADGNTLIVGAPYEDDPVIGNDVGAVYHYHYENGDWVQKYKATGSSPGERFGTHVSLSSDDTKIAVSAPGVGNVHIFDISQTDWPLQATIITQPFRVSEFGYTLDLNQTGNVLVVGTHSREVFVYFDDGESWQPLADTSSVFYEPSSDRARLVKTNESGTKFFAASPGHNYAAKRGGLVETFTLDYDSDLDGVGDLADTFRDVSLGGRQDTDRDGLPDACDAFCELDGLRADDDDDNDGIPDSEDAFPLISSAAFTDTDQDGLPDFCATYCADLGLLGDDDDDNDGIPDRDDAFPLDPDFSKDTDGDGIADALDDDLDGDGVANVSDVFPEDGSEQIDSDGDGVGDNADAFPQTASEQFDLDNDGIGDNTDLDRDGDDVLNAVDALPDDPREVSDNDLDGLGDNADIDDDNDGLWDVIDPDPLQALDESSNARMLWVRTHRLEGDQEQGLFGQSVDFAADSNTLAVAANRIDDSGLPGAQVFDTQNDLVATVGNSIKGPVNAPRADRVAISGDASTVALNDGGASVGDTQTGAVSVFDFTSGAWVQRGDPISRPATYDFASRLSVNIDGSVVGMGSTSDFRTSGGFAGFKRFNTNNWELVGDYIFGTDSNERLSWGMAINRIGNIVALGAPLAEGPSGTPVDTGKVEVYEYSQGVWKQLGSTLYGTTSSEFFGSSVALNAAGDILAVGSDAADSVSLYRLTEGEWRAFGAVPGACGGRLGANWRGVELDETGYRLSISRQCLGYETHDVLYYFDGIEWRDTGAELDNRIGDNHQMGETSLAASGLKKAIGVPGYDSAGLTDNGLVDIFELRLDSDGDGIADILDAFPVNFLYYADADGDLSPDVGGETLVVDLRKGVALSAGFYSGLVRLDFAGSPESNPYDDTTEDAFYYIDSQENTRFEPQLARLGSTASVGCFNVEQQLGESIAVVDAITFIDKEGFVAPGNPPAYNSSHEYSVVVDLGHPVRRISIAHADCGFWDNSGYYTVQVTSVEPVPNSAQVTSIDKTFKIKGIGRADRFTHDPAASVDTDDDGYPDEWNTNASSEQIAQSALTLDSFPRDPAAAIDSDGDGYPDSWNEGVGGELIELSDLSLDVFPTDPNEWIDTDSDGIGNNADEDDDGDGTPDTEDYMPLDASESVDTDGDGVGNNADPDDDGDGYADEYELEMEADPLDYENIPRSVGLPPAILRLVHQKFVKDDGGF